MITIQLFRTFIPRSRLLVVSLLLAAFLISCSGKRYTRQGAIENFEERETEMMQLVEYFRKQKPGKNEVFFEPDGNRYTISISIPGWAIHPEYPLEAGRNMRLKSAEMDTFLRKLNWTHNAVSTLKEKLKKANCKHIRSDGEDVILHYGTNDWSSYWYIIFDKPLPDSIIKKQKEAGVTFLRDNVRIGSAGTL